MLVVLLLNSSNAILVFCWSCVSSVALNGNIFCIGTEIPILLFSNKWIHPIRCIFLCCQKSAVMGHRSSVNLVSPGLCLCLFPPHHTSILPPLCHLQMAIGIHRIFFLTTSQLNSFDSFEACCVTNNLTLPPIGVIDLLHRLQWEHPPYQCRQLPRI